MLRKNLMSAVYAAVAAGAVLVVYNAFMHGNVSQANTASSRLSVYLGLDKVKQEEKSDENNVVGTDNGSAASTSADSATTQTPATPSQAETTDQSTATATPSVTSPAATPTVQTAAKAETVYTVKDGDTYGCIAEKYYGSYEHYLDVMAANPVYQQGFGEYQLYVGAQLTLPAVAKENLKPASSLCQ